MVISLMHSAIFWTRAESWTCRVSEWFILPCEWWILVLFVKIPIMASFLAREKPEHWAALAVLTAHAHIIRPRSVLQPLQDEPTHSIWKVHDFFFFLLTNHNAGLLINDL